MIRIVAALLVTGFACTGWAHKASDSFLRIQAGDDVAIEWDIALRDLEYAIGLDQDSNGAITVGELDASLRRISAYALARLQLSAAAGECELHLRDTGVGEHSDGPYVVLHVAARCPSSHNLWLDYTLLFDIDSTHRALVRYTHGQRTFTHALHDTRRRVELPAPSNPSNQADWLEFAGQGVWHIWIGYDHILFLVTLLLPVVLYYRAGRCLPVQHGRAVFVDVAKTVTAFTCAHSATLTLAVMDLMAPPARGVESAIAASVVIAALANLLPRGHGARWRLAGLFGLVHGFGFANVLNDLGLPAPDLALTLLSFNLGVEFGQLVIVAALLPMCYALRNCFFYHRAIVQTGSLVIALIGAIWFIERAFDVRLLPA